MMETQGCLNLSVMLQKKENPGEIKVLGYHGFPDGLYNRAEFMNLAKSEFAGQKK